MKKLYLLAFIFTIVISCNAYSAQSQLQETRETISSKLGGAVNTLKGYFSQTQTFLNTYTTKSEDLKQTAIDLKSDASSVNETNPSIMPHGESAVKECTYEYQNIAWDSSKEVWFCSNADLAIDCDPAQDEYLVKSVDDSYICAKTAGGGKPNYYWRFEGSGKICDTQSGLYKPVYECYYKNKQNQEIMVERSNCANKPKPNHGTLKSCQAAWVQHGWQSCSNNCGAGTQYQDVTCPEGMACLDAKPATSRSCTGTTCTSPWKTGAWSLCSGVCVHGSQSRSVYCPAGYTCPGSKPSSIQYCHTGRPPCCIPVPKLVGRQVQGPPRCSGGHCYTTMFGTTCSPTICYPTYQTVYTTVIYQKCWN